MRLELAIFDSVLLEPLIVLFVSVSEPARVASVPVVGNVTFVAPVVVRVRLLAPEVVKLPAKVTVNEPLLTPVPPLAGFKIPPKTTAPVVAVTGVKPVAPALNEITPPAWEN